MPSVSGLDLAQGWASLDVAGRAVSALVSVGVGLLLAFFGFRLFRLVLVLAGAALGAWAGLSLTAAPAPAAADGASPGLVAAVGAGAPLFQGDLARWLVPLVLALLGAALLWGLYRLGALLFGAALGLALLGSVGTSLAVPTDVQWLLLLVGLVGGAVLGWMLQTLVLIVTTALAGGWGVATGVYLLVHLQQADAAATVARWSNGAFPVGDTPAVVTLAGALLLALLGASFQARDHARRRARRA